ncbi:hypothetical protein TNCT_571751, partial [Trichonephila clavata]
KSKQKKVRKKLQLVYPHSIFTITKQSEKKDKSENISKRRIIRGNRRPASFAESERVLAGFFLQEYHSMKQGPIEATAALGPRAVGIVCKEAATRL